jgi:MFS family permease
MTAADAPDLSYSSASGRWVLAVSVLGSGIAALDATVVNIALPTIGRDFRTGVAALQLVMNGYTLTLAAFLLIGGSLGDRFGRRKVYLIGTVWFAPVSAACGFAPDVAFLIITRVLQGVGAALGLAVFLTWERHAASPMLPLSIFAQRQFAAVNAVAFIVYAALTGATFLLPVTLQVVSGYSPLGSGLALLPLTIIMLVLSGRSGQLAARIGPRLQLSAGPLVVGAGLAMLTLAPSGSSYVLYVMPTVVVFGLGLGLTVAPLTATAMSSAPSDHAGIASAVNNDVARFGGLLAVAILPALAGITGTAYLHPDALAAGFRTAVLISGALCAVGGLLAAVTITNPARGHRDAAMSEQCLHCGLDAPPLTTTAGQTAGTDKPASARREP